MKPTAASAVRSLSAVESALAFRALLGAVAAPGTSHSLPVADAMTPLVVSVLSLLDLDTRFSVVGDSKLGEVVAERSGAALVELADADFVVVTVPLDCDTVNAVSIGSAVEPERGARLFVTATSQTTAVELTGPGVAGVRSSELSLPPAPLAALQRRNRRFPSGIDTWIVHPDHTVVCLPRSVRVLQLDRSGI